MEIMASKPTTIPEWLAYSGLILTPSMIALEQQYGNGQTDYSSAGNTFLETVVRRNMFAGPDAPTNYNFHVASLIARALIYSPSNGQPSWGYSPCPNSGQVGLNESGVQGAVTVGRTIGLGVQGVTFASSVGGASSLGFAAAGTVASVALSTVTLGVGLVLGPLLALIQQHAQAVKAEDSGICSVKIAFDSTVPQIDLAVATGSVTAAQGYTAMQSLISSLIGALMPISGPGASGHPCNAGCEFQAMLKMHLDFSNQLYQDITTMKPLITVPGGVSIQPSQQAGITAQVANQIAPPPGSAYIAQSTMQQNSNNLNAAGSQGGTFSAVPNILTDGTGTAAPVQTSMSSMWLILFGVVLLFGAIAFFHKG